MANKIPRVKIRGQDKKERITNFNEVYYGYNLKEAQLEASRCLQCKNPRCTNACPVNINIPKFIKEILNSNIEKAGEIIAENSTLPAVCGRVCPQETQCEGSCVLNIKSESVAIGKLERFVADTNLKNNVKFGKIEKTNGIKVAVIGSGPAGLSCAGDLAKMGYSVKIFEALHKAGGVLQYGIPEFRLPKDKIVEKEIKNIIDLGVEIETNVVVGKTCTIEDLFENGFEAIFIGSGAGLPKFMNIEGENANTVFSANEYLTRVNLMKAFDDSYDTPIKVGKHTVIVGGGNVAMDAARTALRLGSKSTIIYRRTEEYLPARKEEIQNAKDEGVNFCLLTNPIKIHQDENGNVTGIRCIKMELDDSDDSERRRPVPIDNSEYDIECDTVIMALGTSPNPLIIKATPDLETNKRGLIVADEKTGITSIDGVFAGGDIVNGAATVILAMGAGKKSAKSIDEYLKKKHNL